MKEYYDIYVDECLEALMLIRDNLKVEDYVASERITSGQSRYKDLRWLRLKPTKGEKYLHIMPYSIKYKKNRLTMTPGQIQFVIVEPKDGKHFGPRSKEDEKLDYDNLGKYSTKYQDSAYSLKDIINNTDDTLKKISDEINTFLNNEIKKEKNIPTYDNKLLISKCNEVAENIKDFFNTLDIRSSLRNKLGTCSIKGKDSLYQQIVFTNADFQINLYWNDYDEISGNLHSIPGYIQFTTNNKIDKMGDRDNQPCMCQTVDNYCLDCIKEYFEKYIQAKETI